MLLRSIKTHNAVTEDTVSRLCKSLLKESGINIDNYSFHSSGTSASSCKIAWRIYMYHYKKCRLDIWMNIWKVLWQENRSRDLVPKLLTEQGLRYCYIRIYFPGVIYSGLFVFHFDNNPDGTAMSALKISRLIPVLG